MSLSLDDLGRAAYEAACDAQTQDYPDCVWVAWESLDNNDKRVNGLSALAAVERFAEEALNSLNKEYEHSEMLRNEAENMRCHEAEDAHELTCMALGKAIRGINTLLSSLRAEAGQGQAKKGSE